jgi:serine/threonine protein kinase
MSFTLSDYEIIDEIGQGGFGTVFRARQKSLNRLVALKSLSAGHAQDRSSIMRFRREAQAMASLAHDTIVSVFDYGYQAGNYYLVMEYIEGITLQDALDRNMDIEPALFVLSKVCTALEFAHNRGIIHRDIKPGNILLGCDGRVKLADFGLASFRDGISPQSSTAAVGTLSYMAPETMVSPREIDPRADVFSLGCVLYQFLAGSVPFAGTTIAEVSYKLLNEAASEPQVDPAQAPLAKLAMECLHKDRDQRPGMEKIESTLLNGLRQEHRVIRSKLVAFVCGSCTRGEEEPPALPSRPPVPFAGRRNALPMVYGSIAAVAVALLVLILLLPGGPFRKERIRPTLGSLPLELETAGTTARAITRAPTRRQTDGPAPLTGSERATPSATLTVSGLSPEDSLFVDGAPLTLLHKKRTRRMKLSPGHYRLEIRRTDGSRMERTVEIMPYQVVEWDIRKGKNHDRR